MGMSIAFNFNDGLIRTGEASYVKRHARWKSGDKFNVPLALRSRSAASAWIRWGHFWGHFFDTQSKIPDFMRARGHCSIALLTII